MKARNIVLLALVWALSLVGTYLWTSRGGTMTLQQDLVEIEKLRQRAAAPGLKALTYGPEAREVVVTSDGWAFEWGSFTATFVLAPGADVQTMKAHRMIVYRKQPDGTWRAARGMTSPAG
jgi:hypothetical protein